MREPDELKVSRKIGYAATLKTAPAYTFGGRNDRPNNDPGPGPGAYEPSLEHDKKGGGFGSSSRYKALGQCNPSPQDYVPTGSDLTKAAAYTFRIKQPPDHLKSKTPGPGAYNQDAAYKSVRPGVPAVSIAHRPPDSAYKDSKPGPNEYNPDYRTKEQPGVSLKFRHERVDNSDMPGPNQYQRPLERPNNSPSAKTFGVSRSDANLDNGVPGPIYSLEPGYTATKPHRSSWSIGKSPRDSRLDNGVPGPGQYGMHAPVMDRPAGHSLKSGERSQPAYTIPGKPYSALPPGSPGPSDYNPKDVRKSAPMFTLHGHETLDSRRNNPGPGAYNQAASYKVTRPSAPAVSISHRQPESAYKDQKPGPGTYTSDYRVKEQPGVTLKFRHDLNQDQGTPAPHDYADKDFRSIYGTGTKRKGISFGVKHRAYVQEDVPGPEYNIGCSTLCIAAATPVPKSQLT